MRVACRGPGPCSGPLDHRLRTARTLSFLRAALLRSVALIGIGIGQLPAQTRHVVLEEAEGTAVGMSVLIQTGNAWEGEDEAGLNYLAAEAVAEQVRPRLHAMGAQVAVRCNASATEFSLLLPVEGWRASAGLFLEALFKQPVDEGSVERARARLARRLATADGDFTGEVRRGLAAVLHAGSPRWARDPCNLSRALQHRSPADVQRWVRTRFLATRATAAIAGPVDGDAAGRLLSRALGDSQLPLLLPAPSTRPSSEMLRVERNVVTTWVAIAFPFPRGANAEALGLLAHQIEEATRPDIGRPEVYDVGVELLRHGEGGALIVYMITEPAHAERWVRRVRRLVDELGAKTLDEPQFEALRRRYRGHRLRRLDAPEARAREAANQLFFEGGYSDPGRRLERLSPRLVREIAASLGQPAIVLLGPP